MPKLTLVDRATGFRAGTSQLCDNCGAPGVLDADRHCARCAELAHEADAYGSAVALDLLRTTILGARAYASRREIERAVERALDDYDD
jgi:hypothetical protein